MGDRTSTEAERKAMFAGILESTEWRDKLEKARAAREQVLAAKAAANTPRARAKDIAIYGRIGLERRARRRRRLRTAAAFAGGLCIGLTGVMVAGIWMTSPPGDIAASAPAATATDAPPRLIPRDRLPSPIVAQASQPEFAASPETPQQGAASSGTKLAAAPTGPTARATFASTLAPIGIAPQAKVDRADESRDVGASLSLAAYAPQATKVRTRQPPNRGPAAERALSGQQKRTLQRNLTDLGFDTGGVDGVFGRNTRAAITRWQRANRVAATGRLSSGAIQQISRQISRQYAARKTAPAAVARPTVTTSEGCARDDRGRIIANVGFVCDLKALGEALRF